MKFGTQMTTQEALDKMIALFPHMKINKDGEPILISTQWIRDAMAKKQMTLWQVLETYQDQKTKFDTLAHLGSVKRMKLIHQMADMMLEIFKFPKETTSCKKGCSACCYTEVAINIEEAKLLLDEYDIDWEHIRRQLMVDDHYKLNYKDRKCVFLKNNECSVYENRPLSCRKYFVMNDPVICDENLNPKGKTTVLAMGPLELLWAGMQNYLDSGWMPEMLLKAKKGKIK